MLAHRKRRPRPSATDPVTYLVELWQTKEVVAPVLSLPLPRISSPSILFNSLRPQQGLRRRRKARSGDIKLALL